MDDYAYLVSDSNSAWLGGRGDGRFERYEKFYHAERASCGDRFDLEHANEAYSRWLANRPPRLAFLARPAIGRVAVALFCVYMAAQLVPALAARAPQATGILLVVTFVGLRLMHRRRRKRK